ncbi:MAG: DEAD/DEAH box helicase family protein [Spirochaetia bacterium]|nr:DEAD/DEAH box helicase family protein [Spirochaetia bacterium]
MIAETFRDTGICVVEAGTGTGKSYAYLVPAMLWCLENSDEKIVIATSTINLQHQLFEKDIPTLCKLLAISLKAEILKGRSNYICMRKLFEEIQEGPLLSHQENEAFKYLCKWVENTSTGMFSELEKHIHKKIWNRVCSDSEFCLKNRCPHREGCFVLRARKRASAAHIIIVNHHLLFADMIMRKQEQIDPQEQAILPPFDRLIIDEAHNIEKNATSYFTEEYSNQTISRLMYDLHHMKFGKQQGIAVRILPFISSENESNQSEKLNGLLESLRIYTDKLELFILDIFTRFHQSSLLFETIKEKIDDKVYEQFEEYFLSLHAILKKITRFNKQLIDDCIENDDSFPVLQELRSNTAKFNSASLLLKKFSKITTYPKEIFWLDSKKNMTGSSSSQMKITPVSVAETIYENILSVYNSVICTSATLTAGDDFSFWEKQVGLYGRDLPNYRKKYFPSPFNFKKHLFLGIPINAPLPFESEKYESFVCDFTCKLINSSEGGTLVLFTSYALLKKVHEYLLDEMDKDKDKEKEKITLLYQGEKDRTKLLAEFIRDEKSVLLATESFWEGVDAPGNTLRSVIITRLPFRVPSDPIVSARYKALEKSGGNPFLEISLPEAAVRLKQGFGRLLRNRFDRGGVFILDSRIIHKYYGRILLNSLPDTLIEIQESDRITEKFENFLYSGK